LFSVGGIGEKQNPKKGEKGGKESFPTMSCLSSPILPFQRAGKGKWRSAGRKKEGGGKKRKGKISSLDNSIAGYKKEKNKKRGQEGEEGKGEGKKKGRGRGLSTPLKNFGEKVGGKQGKKK